MRMRRVKHTDQHIIVELAELLQGSRVRKLAACCPEQLEERYVDEHTRTMQP